MASFVSAFLIVIILLYVAPIFKILPRASLGTISLVASITMILQFRDLKRFAQQGYSEISVWIVTFLTVVITDIPIGLWVGLFASALTFYIKGWKNYSHILGVLPNTDIYVDIETHETAVEIPKIKIFRYCGSINFVTRTGFKRKLLKKVGVTRELTRNAFDCNSNKDNFFVSMYIDRPVTRLSENEILISGMF